MGTSAVVTTTLTDFLLARIAEDEEAVNARTRHLSPGGWSYLEQFGDFGDDERWMIEIPASRVLAECEAKRRIVELHRNQAFGDYWTCEVCTDTEYGGLDKQPCETLRLLALPYADHPDYREDWKV